MVYHEVEGPAARRVLAAVARLVRGLARRTGLRVAALPLGLLGALGPGDAVFALLLVRGGHWLEVMEAARRAGARLLGSVPDSLVVRLLAAAAARVGAACLVVRARGRGRGLRDAHLSALAERVEALTGRAVYVDEGPPGCAALELSAAAPTPWGTVVAEELVEPLEAYVASLVGARGGR